MSHIQMGLPHEPLGAFEYHTQCVAVWCSLLQCSRDVMRALVAQTKYARITPMNESCHTFEWGHVTHLNVDKVCAYHTHE